MHKPNCVFGGLIVAPACLAALLLSGPGPAADRDDAPAYVPAQFADLSWRLVGPYRGGWSEMVAGIASRPDTFYFGAAGGGVWRTDNAGHTWTSVFDQGATAPVGALAIAPSDPDTVYIGTGQPEPRYDIAGGSGVFGTHDGGKSWVALGLQQTRYIGRIWVNPTDANTLLVAAVGHFFGPDPQRGVFRSTDGGRHWSQVLKVGDDTGAVDLAADPGDAQTLVAATWQVRQFPWQSYFTPVVGPGSALYLSNDGGRSWSRLGGQGWPAGDLGRISVATARTASGLRIYAVIAGAAVAGLYRSDDAGAIWQRVNDEHAFTDSYASRITVAPDDPDTVYLVGQSLRRCTGGGKSCEIIKGEPGGDDYHFVWINPSRPDHMAAASDQGTVISVDGGATWSSWYNQPTGQFYHLATDRRFPFWIYPGQQDSGSVAIASRSDYGSINFRDWHPVGGEERGYEVPDPADPDIVYGSGPGGEISQYDTVTGQIANITPCPIPTYGKRPTLFEHHFAWITPLALSRAGPPTLYAGGEVVFASSDRGQHWSVISPDLTGKKSGAQRCDGAVAIRDAKACGYGNIWSLVTSAHHAGELWVGTDDGLIQLTRDGGAHWQNVTPRQLPEWAKVASLDLGADGTAYAAIDNQRQDDWQPRILKTHDYGATWQEAAGDLPGDHFVSVVRADPLRAKLLYAGTETGIFVSFDDGAHWSSLQQNLPTAWVRDLLVHGDSLVAATQGRAIWVLDDLSPLREVRGAAPSVARPYLFKPAVAYRIRGNSNRDTPLPPEEPAGQNPPAGAIIDYWLPTAVSASVEIEIRDATGQLVNRLSSNPQTEPEFDAYYSRFWIRPTQPLSREPGLHRVAWNLRYPRPRSIEFEYVMGAAAGADTPVSPQGPLVLPGHYQVILKAGSVIRRRPLTLVEDPRVRTTPADLEASLALSQRIAQALSQTRRGYGEMTAANQQLAATLAALRASHADPSLIEQVTALVGHTKTPDQGPSFDRTNAILAGIETNLEGADLPPTGSQRQVAAATERQIEALWKHWVAIRDRDIAQLNGVLHSRGLPAISIPPPDQLIIKPPPAGEDLP